MVSWLHHFTCRSLRAEKSHLEEQKLARLNDLEKSSLTVILDGSLVVFCDWNTCKFPTNGHFSTIKLILVLAFPTLSFSLNHHSINGKKKISGRGLRLKLKEGEATNKRPTQHIFSYCKLSLEGPRGPTQHIFSYCKLSPEEPGGPTTSLS